LTGRTEEDDMNRRTFDALLASGGVAIAIVLLIAGGLLTWGHSFIKHQVHSQLAQQQIFFPPKGSDALAPKAIGPYLNKYAGKQMLTGQEAEAYADHFIAVHLQEIGGGKTYAQLSAASLADPKNTALAAQVATVFKGETLRGLLLNAYAFGKLGTIAGIAAIVSYAGALVMLLLAALGFMHLRRTPPDAEVFARLGAHTVAPTEV
jgi:hypothetical protein